jgi:diadenosine tetraphosphate (Ap4A) HIT family hydrolase
VVRLPSGNILESLGTTGMMYEKTLKGWVVWDYFISAQFAKARSYQPIALTKLKRDLPMLQVTSLLTFSLFLKSSTFGVSVEGFCFLPYNWNMIPCVFCEINIEKVVSSSPMTLTIRDEFPISKGHTLVISKRHIAAFFDASDEEVLELMNAVKTAKEQLDIEFSPSGYNIGINSGECAGQTVQHLHIHLIPRYENDVIDPRGGVRWIIPEKANYWE